MIKPMQQVRLPQSRNRLRPKRSEFAPAIKNPIELPVVYAGTYHAMEVGSLKKMESLDCRAAVVRTGQKERPKVDESTKMTNQVFQVISTVSPSLF